jgi:hypothetical protein
MGEKLLSVFASTQTGAGGLSHVKPAQGSPLQPPFWQPLMHVVSVAL